RVVFTADLHAQHIVAMSSSASWSSDWTRAVCGREPAPPLATDQATGLAGSFPRSRGSRSLAAAVTSPPLRSLRVSCRHWQRPCLSPEASARTPVRRVPASDDRQKSARTRRALPVLHRSSSLLLA